VSLWVTRRVIHRVKARAPLLKLFVEFNLSLPAPAVESPVDVRNAPYPQMLIRGSLGAPYQHLWIRLSFKINF